MKISKAQLLLEDLETMFPYYWNLLNDNNNQPAQTTQIPTEDELTLRGSRGYVNRSVVRCDGS